MGVEAVLQPGQDFGRFAALAAPDDVAEIVEAFDAGGGDDQRFGGGVAVRGERVGDSRRDDQQVAGSRDDDAIVDQQVEGAVEDVEQLGGGVVAVRHGADDLILAVPRGDPLARRTSIRLGDPALKECSFVDYRADSALHAQIDAACAAAGLARRTVCEAQNMQYLTELVQHGLGVSILPPMSLRAVTPQVRAVRITPPLRRDLCAVIAAGHPPTGAAQALLDLLADHS